MTQLSMLGAEEKWGATARRDAWWVQPLLVFLGLSAFLVYGTWAAWQGEYFEIRVLTDTFSPAPPRQNAATHPYLSPFYSPLIYDVHSHHAWIKRDLRPSWLPSWFPFTAGFLILGFPGLFRLTCYYYRKAYYRAFWQDPPACAVREPRKSYWGENHWPLLFQNLHRYFLYFALIFLVFLAYDAVLAFTSWPTDRAGHLHQVTSPQGDRVIVHQFGMGLGSLIMLVNVVLLSGFTLGCNSLRHLVGGRLDCFSCPHARLPSPPEGAQVTMGYRAWRWVSWFNLRHSTWAWLSLFSVGFTDFYIRMCAMGAWKDPRFF